LVLRSGGFEELVEEREIGIEALMLLAAAAALIFLCSLAEAIEELTFARTRSAIRDLLDFVPKQARLLVEGREETVPAEDLSIGDRFLGATGEALPTDGIIRARRSTPRRGAEPEVACAALRRPGPLTNGWPRSPTSSPSKAR